MEKQEFDVIIIGAGISGIGAACHLRKSNPKKTFAILERRKAMGGTWDLFRYPGIRSDSDMLTFGFNFRPWAGVKTLADGPSIKQYIIDTARENKVDKDVRYSRKVTKASWSTSNSNWTVEVLNEDTGKNEFFHSKFVISCCGYYKYDSGYKPDFPGEKNFKGQIIHPQQWPENLDYKGKSVVIIGSGATAITLMPAMADKTSHITMLQRSPTYIASVPAIDKISQQMSRFIPQSIVYTMARARNILLQRVLFWASKEQPGAVRRLLLSGVKSQLNDGFDMKHFTPKYNPWDERLCVVPDGDLFKYINEGKASVVTDEIDKFTSEGIRLKSGNELKADIIISATGLNVQLLGGVELFVDDKKVEFTDKLTYKGVLVEDIPNAAIIFGYTNASWTLKVDIACEYFCRLLNYMDSHHYRTFIPVDDEGCKTKETVMGGLNSGYIRRAINNLPKQGSKDPWRITNDYLLDSAILKFSSIQDSKLHFK